LQDGKLRLFLPAVDAEAPLKERFAAALNGATARADGIDRRFLHEIAASGNGFSARIVIGGPELYRNDRRRQYIFANGRRINDFALQQALEYGSQGCFPNGVHPIGAIFLEVDPAKADFNVHPAKREARFADSAAIHHEITSALRSFFRHISLSGRLPAADVPAAVPGGAFDYGEHGGRPSGNAVPTTEGGRAALERILSGEYGFAPLPGRGGEDGSAETAAPKLRYAGRVFGLFILAEDDERLYIIDQHAAHERILYDRFLSEPPVKQDLLAPITFGTETAEDDGFLAAVKPELERLGVVINGGSGSWRIEALPALWRLGDGDTVNEVLSLRSADGNIAERWAATLACHAAVRDGDYLDGEAALALAERALALPVQRCPHGRPILVEIKRSDLFKAVRRTA
jgi:DNA mismatch repair protein MutL